MKILALEFSTARRSVAIAVDGMIRSRANEESGRETHAFALCRRVLDEACLQPADIDCVAVGIGPGSYAGIRIAISIAQGWQLARGVKLVGVSSAECAAAQAHAEGLRGTIRLIIDAQRGQLFAADYTLNQAGGTLVAPFRLLTENDQLPPASKSVRFDVIEHASIEVIVPDAAMLARLASLKTDFVTGPDLEPIYLRKAEFVKAPPPRMNV